MIPDLYDRKLKLSEIFAEGWRIYRRYFIYLVAFVLPVEFLAQMLQVAVPHENRVLRISVLLPAELITVIGLIVVIFITAQATATQPVSWGECRNKISGTLGRAMWATIIVSVILIISLLPFLFVALSALTLPSLAVSMIFLTLPAMILAIYFLFVIHAVVLRSKKGVPALFYSWRLVRHRWWYVLIAVILLNLPVSLIHLAAHFALRASGFYTSAVFTEGFNLIGSVMGIYSTILVTLFFLNIDREGLKEKVDALRHPVNPD